jgi:transcriptional regulator with GAF, ATPase, and Fis domain
VESVTPDELRRVVADLSADDSLPRALDHVVSSAKAFFSVSGAGIMFADEEHVLRYVIATDSGSRRLEEAQREEGRGPCVDALVLDTSVDTRDVMDDARWPGLRTRLAGSEVHAVLGMPLHLAGAPIGSIDLYRDASYAWQDAERESFAAYAALVERLFLTALRATRQEALAEQLQRALDHRVVIERAVGMLMAERALEAPDAFEALRALARNSRRKAYEVAEDILARRDG